MAGFQTEIVLDFDSGEITRAVGRFALTLVWRTTGTHERTYGTLYDWRSVLHRASQIMRGFAKEFNRLLHGMSPALVRTHCANWIFPVVSWRWPSGAMANCWSPTAIPSSAQTTA
jgi:hypothetical protein